MDYSRTGGATMKMPPSNFSQSGLASIFGIDLDADTKAPSMSSRKKIAIIAIIAGTVCGGVVLVALVVLGVYMAWRWRKKHAHVEDPVYEKDVQPDIHVGHLDVHEGAVERVEARSNLTGEQPRPDGSP